MSVHRFFCSRKGINDGVFTVVGEEGYHGAKVLRLKPGDQINIFTEQRSEFSCTVLTVKKASFQAEIVEKLERSTESALHLTLIQGLPKAAKLEQIIVHGTELGMSKLVPAVCERSFKSSDKRERWRRLALEATKQSGRMAIPFIEPITALTDIDFSTFDDSLKLVAAEPPHKGSLKTLLSGSINSIVVAVGPEGGFSDDEFNFLFEKGFQPFSMGPRILRTQTASLAAFAAIQNICGDWD